MNYQRPVNVTFKSDEPRVRLRSLLALLVGVASIVCAGSLVDSKVRPLKPGALLAATRSPGVLSAKDVGPPLLVPIGAPLLPMSPPDEAVAPAKQAADADGDRPKRAVPGVALARP